MPLGQKCNGMALLPCDFLGRVFCNRVMICGAQGGGVFDIQFFLAGLGLAFGVFDGDAGILQVVAQRAHHMFLFGGLQDVVIFVVSADGLQIAELVLADIVKAFLEQKEF